MSYDAAKDATVSPSIRAEAAAWVAQLHGSNRSHAVEAGLRRWLEASPAHVRAFELATEAWELGGSVSHQGLPRLSRPRRRRSMTFAWAATATVAATAAVFAAMLYLRAPAVSTGIGEQRALALEDGTRIHLNTDTQLLVNYDETSRRVRLENGEALFDVAKSPDRPFIVTAGDREITALGTSFVVRRDQRRVAVTLVEGKVSVAPLSSAQDPVVQFSAVQTLIPGQRLTFSDDDVAALDRPVLDEVTAWQRGEVVLDHTSLADAIEEMNRYSVVKLAIEDSAAAGIQVSGIFRAGDSARFALAVAETYGLQVSQQPRLIVLSGARPK